MFDFSPPYRFDVCVSWLSGGGDASVGFGVTGGAWVRRVHVKY